MARANLSVLTETIIPVGSLEHIADIAVPTVERIYHSDRACGRGLGSCSPARYVQAGDVLYGLVRADTARFHEQPIAVDLKTKAVRKQSWKAPPHR